MDLASAPMRSPTGPARVNDPPQWAAMLRSLPLGPVQWRGSGILSPPAPRGLAVGPGQLLRRRGTRHTIASLARPAHAPAIVFRGTVSLWGAIFNVGPSDPVLT